LEPDPLHGEEEGVGCMPTAISGDTMCTIASDQFVAPLNFWQTLRITWHNTVIFHI